MLRSDTPPRYATPAPGIMPVGLSNLAETASMLGRPLRGWAEILAAPALERTAGRSGRWRYPLVVLSVPRQAGKTTLVGTVAIDRCLRTPGARVYYTAQSRLDAVLRFADFADLLAGSALEPWPAYRRHVAPGEWDYRVTTGAGNEVIAFPNGSELRIFAPRDDSLHGSVTDLVIIDEARFFDTALGNRLLAAALPTQVTRDGQVWIVSTAGGPASTFLAEQVERGRLATEHTDTRIAFAEWSIPDDTPAGNLLEAVWSAHPAAGVDGGLARAAVELAAETMPAWQFAQEYGNRWLTEELDRLIPGAWWTATISATGAPLGDAPLFAFDSSPDRQHSAIVACGGGVLEVAKAERGARWLAPEVARMAERWGAARVIADPAGPAVTAIEELRPLLGERLVTVKTRELVAACGSFYDALEAAALRHLPHPALDSAVERATQRAVAGSYVYSRSDGGHLLTAAALAWWGTVRPTEQPNEDPAVY